MECFSETMIKGTVLKRPSKHCKSPYVADVLLKEGAELHVYDPMVKADRIHQDLTTLWEARNETKQIAP